MLRICLDLLRRIIVVEGLRVPRLSWSRRSCSAVADQA